MSNLALVYLCEKNRSMRAFEKGLTDRGCWHGGILPMPEIQASFLHPFSLFLP